MHVRFTLQQSNVIDIAHWVPPHVGYAQKRILSLRNLVNDIAIQTFNPRLQVHNDSRHAFLF